MLVKSELHVFLALCKQTDVERLAPQNEPNYPHSSWQDQIGHKKHKNEWFVRR